MFVNDPIVAIATAAGRGAIGVVRISGPGSLEIGAALCAKAKGMLAANRATLAEIVDPESQEVIDQAVVTFFRSPRSFTGDDTVEVSCHGSRVLLAEVVSAAIKLGARAAQPGEFSLRAVLNGKMDLTQAEGIKDLIDATTHWQAKLAYQQVHGSLSRRLSPLKQKLIDQVVQLESAVEFVEENLATSGLDRTCSQLIELVSELERIAQSFEAGRRVREGMRVAIVGRPNVGKSSLFNALLQRERAIVTEIPGTTRDAVSETVELGTIPVTFFDTAGLREATDRIEQIGIERSYSAIADADALVVVFDGSQPLNDDDLKILVEQEARPHALVLNKSDLTLSSERPRGLKADEWKKAIRVSAKSGAGMDSFREALFQLLGAGEQACDGDAILTNARHYELIIKAKASLSEALDAIHQGFTEEIALVGMRTALQTLGEITGETLIEDILGKIFSTFCVGK